eukprot:Amastigsp_a176903_12.p4 type:complete len:181 gc:universal Amastigsp_a176903_12:921-379(-)
MASGDAITTSKSILPALMSAARSSMPTMSAPAALASSALAPCANTATRLVLPVPLGSTTAPRTTWSDFLASMPSCTATSMDSSNLATANSLTRPIASATAYSLLLSILSPMVFWRLVSLLIQHPPPTRPWSGPYRQSCGLQRRGQQPSCLSFWSLRFLQAVRGKSCQPSLCAAWQNPCQA